MSVYTLDPLIDTRWRAFLDRNSRATVYHTPEWLKALNQAYSYEPQVATTCPPGADLSNGILFCSVNSSLTGVRLISLPFSDHCEPLADSEAEAVELIGSMAGLPVPPRCRFIEIRPLHLSPPASTGFVPTAAFFSHQLPLTGGLASVFRGFNRDSVQRKIRRAEREGLSYEKGRSQKLLTEFYRLHSLNRRRHRVPVQPSMWFDQLVGCLGECMNVRVAFKDGKAVASIVTLQFKQSMVYKYGCSDPRYRNLGGLQMLFWRAIQEAINSGLSVFDFGRSDLNDEGLATFKDRWGATRSVFCQWTLFANPKVVNRSHSRRFARRILRWSPAWILQTAGKRFYRHLA